MRIEKFWVVTKPGLVSELGDICFETDAKGFALQFRGGLKEEDILALYTTHVEAEKVAERILAAAKKYHATFREVDQ